MSSSPRRKDRRQQQKRQQQRQRHIESAVQWAQAMAKDTVDSVRAEYEAANGAVDDAFWAKVQRETEDKLLAKKYGIYRQTRTVAVARADNEAERTATD